VQYIFMGFGERQTQGPLREQGRINHWANRANARGLALECQNTPLLFFHVFRQFTMRQNC